jgi:hypothetical protein
MPHHTLSSAQFATQINKTNRVGRKSIMNDMQALHNWQDMAAQQ